MASKEQLRILLQGAETWNKWRYNAGYGQQIDLSGANLNSINLREADLNNVDLCRADLGSANLINTNLIRANLSGARLHGANLTSTNLSDANLSQASLHISHFNGTILREVDLTNAYFYRTTLSNLDLRTVKGLETIKHVSPSSISLDTIYLSNGQIPETFLRGCGVPESFITYMRSLVINPIEYNSCFISYSHKDEDFAHRLYSGLRDKNLRVWYAPEDMKRGEKIHEQIDSAIQVHDRLLLLLSEHSMSSEWVKTEIYKARQRELKQKRRILFPVALVPFEQIKAWEFPDGDTGKDLAREIREYYIPDFTNWKNHDDFEREFAKLLRDLKSAAP